MSDRKRRQYTAEFKREAVELVTNQGYTIAEAARNLGIRAYSRAMAGLLDFNKLFRYEKLEERVRALA